MLEINTNEELKKYVGKVLTRSEPFIITQKVIDDYAKASFDTQWIHTDPERCAIESPYKKPIIHGLLGIALLTHLFKISIILPPCKYQINCAINEAKFISACFVGDHVYGIFKLEKLALRKDFIQFNWCNSLYNQYDKLCLYMNVTYRHII